MKNNKKNKKLHLYAKPGFTLVEIMMVVIIIGIMSATSFLFFENSRATVNLDISQRHLAAAIKLAQSYAIQGRTQIVNDEQKLPCGYGVYFFSKNEFAIFYSLPEETLGLSCQDFEDKSQKFTDYVASHPSFDFENLYRPIVSSDFNFKDIEKFSLEKNVELYFPELADGSHTSLYFSIPNANIYENGTQPLADTVYILEYANLKKSVNINLEGAITEN